MKKVTFGYLLIGLAVFGLALISVLLTGGVEADGGCGPCTGTLRSVTGSGSASTCAQAFILAKADAYSKAWSGAPGCSPCQITDAPVQGGCIQSSCIGSGCASAPKGARWTLNYRCQACSPGGPEGPNL